MTDVVETLTFYFVFNTGVKRGAIIDLIKEVRNIPKMLSSTHVVPFVIISISAT